MGRSYLPVALAVAAGIPIIEGNYLRDVFAAGNPASLLVVVPFLAVPLILTAWQYQFRHVVFFCLATAALETWLVLSWPDLTMLRLLTELGTILAQSALFVLIGHIVSILVSAQRRQRQELAEANRQLVRYAAAMEQLAVSRERNRLARELHDTLAHTLSGLAVQLDAIAAIWNPTSPRTRTMLERALTTTREGLSETRRAMQDLRASPLEDLGLGLAIGNLARNVAQRSHVALELHIANSLGALGPEVEQCYYRVAQETLENVTQHANAKWVSVSLAQAEEQLVLTITDDGRGFVVDSVASEQRYGITGMRERAELVGGVLSVESIPDRGTTIRLETVIPADAPVKVTSEV